MPPGASSAGTNVLAAIGVDVEGLRGAFEELSSLTYQLTENLYARLGAEEGEGEEGDPED